MDGDDDEYFDNLTITRPQQFTHENHIGWDANNDCFDFSQLSKELKSIFKNAGIRKKDLKDKDTALMIYGAIINGTAPDTRSLKGRQKGVRAKASKKDKVNGDDSSNVTPSQRGVSVTEDVVKAPPLMLGSLSNSGIADVGSKTDNSTSLVDQIKNGIKLKKVEKVDKTSVNISKEQEVSMTSKLAAAISDRRKQLTKNQVDSGDEDDAWSDDD